MQQHKEGRPMRRRPAAAIDAGTTTGTAATEPVLVKSRAVIGKKRFQKRALLKSGAVKGSRPKKKKRHKKANVLPFSSAPLPLRPPPCKIILYPAAIRSVYPSDIFPDPSGFKSIATSRSFWG